MDETTLERLAKQIAGAELNYRAAFERYGPGHIETGKKWDKLRVAGDAIRDYFYVMENA